MIPKPLLAQLLVSANSNASHIIVIGALCLILSAQDFSSSFVVHVVCCFHPGPFTSSLFFPVTLLASRPQKSITNDWTYRYHHPLRFLIFIYLDSSPYDESHKVMGTASISLLFSGLFNKNAAPIWSYKQTSAEDTVPYIAKKPASSTVRAFHAF